MFFVNALVAVCTGVTSAVIVTDSDTPPAVIVSLPRSRISPQQQCEVGIVIGLKPSSRP